MLSSADLRRYSRHISLPEIGEAGQQRLNDGSVLVVGAGGLGCPALTYLAAAGVGKIGIVDHDVVELSNLQRQVLYGEQDLGRSKADAAATRLRSLNSQISVEPFVCRFSPGNALQLIEGFDIVLDGSDNFSTRYLVNDVCVASGLPFVAASILGFEGQLSLFNLDGGPTYRCLFPEPPDASASLSCTEAGVLGVLPGVMGALQATEVLKYLLGVGELVSGKLLRFDAKTLTLRSVTVKRDDAVVKATRVREPEYYQGLSCREAGSGVREIGVEELRERLSNGDSLLLVDIREPLEREIASIGGEHIPMGSILNTPDLLPKDREVVVYCRSGVRSRQLIDELQRRAGFLNLINLRGGILDWSRKIDSRVPMY